MGIYDLPPSGHNLPPGETGVAKSTLVSHVCTGPDCEYSWDALMYQELGSWSYENDDEAICPMCGAEGQTNP